MLLALTVIVAALLGARLFAVIAPSAMRGFYRAGIVLSMVAFE
jgi:hypothetical protein